MAFFAQHKHSRRKRAAMPRTCSRRSASRPSTSRIARCGSGRGLVGGGEKAKRAPRRRAAAAITKTRQLTPPHPSFSHHTNKNRTAHPRQLALALRADAGDVEPAQARDRAHAQVVCAACCALCALCCCACVLRGVCVCVCVCLRETAGAPASSAARP